MIGIDQSDSLSLKDNEHYKKKCTDLLLQRYNFPRLNIWRVQVNDVLTAKND